MPSAIADSNERARPVRGATPDSNSTTNYDIVINQLLTISEVFIDSKGFLSTATGSALLLGPSRSNFNQFKIFLTRAALRAGPVDRHVGPASARGNPFGGRAGGFVVYPSADEAHPCLEFVVHVGQLEEYRWSPVRATRRLPGRARRTTPWSAQTRSAIGESDRIGIIASVSRAPNTCTRAGPTAILIPSFR